MDQLASFLLPIHLRLRLRAGVPGPSTSRNHQRQNHYLLRVARR
ncbi:unnamed protein product [Mycena citricolor]|uniref:Uncharacterized protein n=1 Tax=Mycena citricolor TaxID=2018698 RepID=A0AAD2HKG9_9AGAR|nr:unnamed protein product [Mycena citricolor]